MMRDISEMRSSIMRRNAQLVDWLVANVGPLQMQLCKALLFQYCSHVAYGPSPLCTCPDDDGKASVSFRHKSPIMGDYVPDYAQRQPTHYLMYDAGATLPCSLFLRNLFLHYPLPYPEINNANNIEEHYHFRWNFQKMYAAPHPKCKFVESTEDKQLLTRQLQ